jgi:hypothetical protein
MPLSGQIPCANLREALRASERRMERDERTAASTFDHERDSTAKDPGHPAIDLQYDRKILEHTHETLRGGT